MADQKIGIKGKANVLQSPHVLHFMVLSEVDFLGRKNRLDQLWTEDIASRPFG